MAQWQRICLPMQEMQETWVWFLGGEDPLEEKMATESQSLDGIIPRTEEPNGLQSMRLQRLDTTKHSLLGIKSDTLDLPLMALPGRTPLLSGVWPLCSNTCNKLSVESLEESIPLGLIAPSCHSCHLCFYLFDGSRFPQSFTTVCICCYLLDTIKRAGLIAAPCLTKEVLNKRWKVATPACLFRLLGDTAVGERVGALFHSGVWRVNSWHRLSSSSWGGFGQRWWGYGPPCTPGCWNNHGGSKQGQSGSEQWRDCRSHSMTDGDQCPRCLFSQVALFPWFIVLLCSGSFSEWEWVKFLDSYWHQTAGDVSLRLPVTLRRLCSPELALA